MLYSKLYLAAHVALDGPVVDDAGSCHVLEGEALAGEEGYVLGSLAALDLPCYYLAQLVDGFGEYEAGLERVEEVAGFEAQLLARVHAYEARAPDDVAVDLALEQEVGAGGVDVRAWPEPLAEQDRLLRGGGRDDDVLSGRLVGRMGSLHLHAEPLAHLLCERLARLLAAAVDDDAGEVPEGGYRLELALCLPAGPVEAQSGRVLAGEVLRGYAARGAGAHLAEPVRLQDGEQLPALWVEEHRVEAGAGAGYRVGFEPESSDARSAGSHVVQAAPGEGYPAAGAVGGPAFGLITQDRFDGVDGRGHVEELLDLSFSQDQGQGASSLLGCGLSAKILDSMRVLVIDNYDSFTYNLVQYLGELGAEVLVRRNDEVTPEEILELHPDRIVVSPGPCTPKEAGVSVEVIEKVSGHIPILGVCLGHQAIGQAFGAEIVRGKPVHGKTAKIVHDGEGVYKGLQQGFEATRYHSLVIEPESLPEDLLITSRTEDGTIMGVRHRDYRVEGVQFHPESVLTRSGHELLKNFLEV